MTIPPAAILADFPPEVQACTWTLLPSGGGFSGGRVWRGDVNGTPRFALKRWQPSVTAERLMEIHARMTEAKDLGFVPRLTRTTHGQTATKHDGRCWDVLTWMPGTTSFSYTSVQDATHAIHSLAALHQTWQIGRLPPVQCSAIRRRLMILSDWARARFEFGGTRTVAEELIAGVELVKGRITAARTALLDLTGVKREPIPLHGDYWPENVLFVGHRVSAVIDFGNTTTDWPEVDAARFLAELPPMDFATLRAGVELYQSANLGYRLSVPLLEVLATTGRLCSLANWHLRLNAGSPDAGLLPAALPRVRRLVSLIVAADAM